MTDAQRMVPYSEVNDLIGKERAAFHAMKAERDKALEHLANMYFFANNSVRSTEEHIRPLVDAAGEFLAKRAQKEEDAQ